jgi:hypothetical protein
VLVKEFKPKIIVMENEQIVTLKDLMEYDGLYFIGHIIDADGDDWVSEEEALEVLRIVNL